MNNAVFPNYSTPLIDNPEVLELARTINSKPILTVPFYDELKPIGNCYWNVELMVKKIGGSIQYGWIFNIWENILVEAMHHAVWRTPEGILYDVTQNYPMFSNTHTIFLPDDENKPNTLDIVPAYQNHYKLLTADLSAKNFVAAHRNKIELVQQYQSALYDSGYRCEQNRAQACGNLDLTKNISITPPTADIHKALTEIPALISKVDQYIGACILHLNQLSEDHLD